ncbi:MAG: sigma-54 interaction domain-containing protein [Bacillota bacterium]
MDHGILLDNLCRSLAQIARVTGGYAMVMDRQGSLVKVVNSDGNEVAGPEADRLAEFLSGCPHEPGVVEYKPVRGSDCWFLPIGDYVLAAVNNERLKRERELEKSIEEALPYIAMVAGGEAVMFDSDGLRLASFGPEGYSSRGAGEYTALGKEAMQKRRAVFGPSLLEKGAQAVRIPITDKFGIGFNNVMAIRQKRKILESASAYPWQRRYTFDDIVGRSPAIRKCKEQAAQIAAGQSTVLIWGETGTGKELFAQSIHSAGPRRDGPFVAVNCGALPSSLIESQLFGYEEGAFTGAKKGGHLGLFEQAEGGTLLLDEVGEMDYDLQAKLLRVLQEREFVRIGGKKPVAVDARIIASTNKDLLKLVKDKKFRDDLFYRLNVVDIKIPPLRERVEDITSLARYFIRRFNQIFCSPVRRIGEEAAWYLERYNWPGNVRELQNCLERSMNLCDRETIMPEHLPVMIREYVDQKYHEKKSAPDPAMRRDGESLGGAARDAEIRAIAEALKNAGQNRREAAESLGISTVTLWRKMKRYGMV